MTLKESVQDLCCLKYSWATQKREQVEKWQNLQMTENDSGRFKLKDMQEIAAGFPDAGWQRAAIADGIQFLLNAKR